jgi:hypothetical protein
LIPLMPNGLMFLLTFFGKRATRRRRELRSFAPPSRNFVVLAERTREEIVKLFLDREAERLLASFDRTLRLPFP